MLQQLAVPRTRPALPSHSHARPSPMALHPALEARRVFLKEKLRQNLLIQQWRRNIFEALTFGRRGTTQDRGRLKASSPGLELWLVEELVEYVCLTSIAGGDGPEDRAYNNLLAGLNSREGLGLCQDTTRVNKKGQEVVIKAWIFHMFRYAVPASRAHVIATALPAPPANCG